MHKMKSEFLLEVKNLKKSYAVGKIKIDILKNINLKMKKGEFISIQGISGVGKSTFLNLIGALDRADSGDIIMGQKSLSHWQQTGTLHLYRRKMIGFIFQYHYLMNDFTVLENITMPLLTKGYTQKKAAEKAGLLLSEIGLYNRKDHFPEQISGGESQRAAVARAVIHDPALVIADEPTGNLDMKNTLQFIDLLKRMQSEHQLSILVATHENKLAEAAQKKYEMIDGIIHL